MWALVTLLALSTSYTVGLPWWAATITVALAQPAADVLAGWLLGARPPRTGDPTL